MPLFVRPGLYFTWRYFFQLGFLDGKPGLVWHSLQGGWYRFLVDAKIYEILFRTKQVMVDGDSDGVRGKKKIIEEILDVEYNIKF